MLIILTIIIKFSNCVIKCYKCCKKKRNNNIIIKNDEYKSLKDVKNKNKRNFKNNEKNEEIISLDSFTKNLLK